MNITGQHYSALARSSTVGVVRLSEKFEPIDVNAAMLEMMEVNSFEELKGLSAFDVVAPEFAEMLAQEHAKRAAGVTSTYEAVIVGRRGTRRNVMVTAIPVMVDGVFTGTVATCVDISELRSTELALRATMERYRAVVTALGEGVIIIARSGELIELNPSAQKILGSVKPNASLFEMGTGWTTRNEQGRELRPEEWPAAITLATGKPCRDVLVELLRPDGTDTWISVNTQPLFHPHEKMPYACVTSIHDVTPLKKANDELKQREQQLNRLLDAFPDMLFLMSPEGVYLDYRASRPDMLVRPWQEQLGKNFADVMPPDIAEPTKQLLEKATVPGRTESVEYWATIGGKRMCCEARAMRLDENTVLVVVRDVTEAREAEQRFRQQEQEVAHLARLGALGEMVAGISHEINQPLHAIANYAAASLNKLESGEENTKESVEAWLRKIASQAFRASEIVKRFRQFSSPTTRTSTVSVGELIQESLDLVSGEIRKRNVQVEVRNLAGDVSFVVDRIQMQQVLVNLLVNACEAVEGNASNARHVVVLAKIEHGKLVCEVADNGVGLPNISFSQLFDAFYTTKPNGLGLGLPISRTIIEGLGGRIWARNNTPRGSVFGFEIPKTARPKSQTK